MVKATIQRMLNRMGYQVVRLSTSFQERDLEIMQKVKPYTSTSIERLNGLIQAVEYLGDNRIPGDFVECGVWRGGSMMAAIYTLLARQDTSRVIHLFDTYEGMSAPTEEDVMFDGQKASDILKTTPRQEGPGNYWCWASLEDVTANIQSTGYPMDSVHLVKGKVEETIPEQAPEQIALLRLDTDWYESTAHELEHLYPRLSPGGILIIDDYGHWKGARKAVDDYLKTMEFRPFLHRLDYTGRLLIKPQ